MDTKILLVILLIPTAYCACPDSTWDSKDGGCFKVFNKYITWLNADQACAALGAHLVYLDGRPRNYLDGLTGILGNEYSVGARNDGTGWKWSTGNPVVTPWRLRAGQFAVLKKWENSLYGVDANHLQKYICEIDPAALAFSCPDKTWVLEDSSCLKVINNDIKWAEAQTACAAVGAQLVTLDGRPRTFLDGLTGIVKRYEYAVGAKKESTGWKWLGGNPVSTPWGLGPHGQYAVLKKWENTLYGVDSNHEQKYICEIKSPGN